MRECFERHCPIHCQWLPFSEWSECSKSCDNGTTRRVRDYVPAKYGGDECEGDRVEIELCNTQDCPGTHASVHSCNSCIIMIPF